MLLAWCDIDAAAASAFVDSMIRSDNEMLRRIAIYILSERWDVLKALYLPIVRPQFFDVGHLHELYALLRKHFESFSDKEKGATIDAIRGLSIPDDAEGIERAERLQLRWLSAISGTAYAPASAWFNDLTTKYGGTPRRLDYLSYIEVGWGPGPSHTRARPQGSRDGSAQTDTYRNSLAAALQREDTRLEASEMLRGLIDSIVLTPEKGQLRIELRGNLAAMLTAAQKTKRSPETGDLLVPVQLVAGARNPLNLEFSWTAA